MAKEKTEVGKSDLELRMERLSKKRQQLVKLAARGTPVGQIARILEVTDGAVSKALTEPLISELVSDMRFSQETKVADQDAKLDSIQAKLVDRLEEAVDTIWKPGEILTALEKVAKIPRRSAGESPTQTTSQTTVVQISLPMAAREFLVQRNANNQVVQAGEQTLVTMQSQEVAKRFGPTAPAALEVKEASNSPDSSNRAELINAADVESSLGAARAG